jgi:hypothetical protein
MDNNKKKSKLFDDFKISDQSSCEHAIKNGSTAAFISAGFTFILAIIAVVFKNSLDKELSAIIDPGMIFDAVLMLILGYFIRKRSRIASVIIVIYWIYSKIYMITLTGRAGGFFIALIFFMYFLTAMRAIFIWHNKYNSSGEKHNISN